MVEVSSTGARIPLSFPESFLLKIKPWFRIIANGCEDP